jgi:DNA adenine methylase
MDTILERVPDDYERYVEPFVGGGALFFELEPYDAILLDMNPRLVGTYASIANDLDSVLYVLARLRDLGAYRENYYKVREELNAAEDIDANTAARFIYLNRTCFNGLYRENSKGEFNVPVGDYKNPTILDDDLLVAASRCLSAAAMYTGDFTALTALCEKGDFVYLDPPYYTPGAAFTRYNAKDFTPYDHCRLAGVFRDLDRKGCKVLLSSSAHAFVRELYTGYEVEELLAPRTIAADEGARGDAQEFLIRNY